MRKVTMKDIAEKAGISRPSVSMILNNKPYSVTKETRERVWRIARELKYKPNHSAQSLKTGRTNCIGLLGSLQIINMEDYNQARVAGGIQQCMEQTKSRYSLNILGANFGGTSEESFEIIQKGMVDGLILIIKAFDLEKFERDLLPQLNDIDLPFVAVHSTSLKSAYNNIGLDCRYAGYCAAEHFIRLGHRDIGYYLCLTGNPVFDEALEGFKKAFSDYRLEWKDGFIFQPERPRSAQGPSFNRIYDTIKTVKEFPRALFVPQDDAAYAVIKALRERGIRVPEDVAVIGFDDEVRLPYFDLELTTVHHPFHEKGAAAISLLLDILERRKEREKVHQEILKPHLVVRKTCGSHLKR